MHNDAMITTARDTAIISKYAYSVPGLIDMTSTPKYVMPATNLSDYRNIYNRNSMLSNYYSAGYYYTGYSRAERGRNVSREDIPSRQLRKTQRTGLLSGGGSRC